MTCKLSLLYAVDNAKPDEVLIKSCALTFKNLLGETASLIDSFRTSPTLGQIGFVTSSACQLSSSFLSSCQET
jgi:hypothetical protein